MVTLGVGVRSYSPDIDRFTQLDSLRSSSVSAYIYCNDNPVRYMDPSGRIWCEWKKTKRGIPYLVCHWGTKPGSGTGTGSGNRYTNPGDCCADYIKVFQHGQGCAKMFDHFQLEDWADDSLLVRFLNENGGKENVDAWSENAFCFKCTAWIAKQRNEPSAVDLIRRWVDMYMNSIPKPKK